MTTQRENTSGLVLRVQTYPGDPTIDFGDPSLNEAFGQVSRAVYRIRRGQAVAALASLLLDGVVAFPPCPHVFARIDGRDVGQCFACGGDA